MRDRLDRRRPATSDGRLEFARRRCRLARAAARRDRRLVQVGQPQDEAGRSACAGLRSVWRRRRGRSMPPLSGIIEAPTIRPDGSLLIEPGYDDAAGLLFDPGDTAFPPIPNEPTREQAEAALRTLVAPFKDFPFIDDVARSVALAAVLTVLVRRAYCAPPRCSHSTHRRWRVARPCSQRCRATSQRAADPT